MTARRRVRTAPAAAGLVWLALGACADGGGDGAPQAPSQTAPPAATVVADAALAEIEAFQLAPGQTLDVIEVRDERGAVSLRRGVLRDADGMVNHGHFQRWHPNGQMAEDGHYLAGARHGRYTVIADSGLKETEIEYRRGVKHGEALAWGNLGALRERAHYTDGVLDGEYESRSGATWVKGRYDKGVEVGLWTWTDLEGHKQREGHYEAGVRTGTWRTWHAGEVPASEEPYVDGVLEGLVVEYDEAGARSAERTYVAGAPHGESREYDPGGALVARITYVAGEQHGPQSRWYADGVLQMEGSMEHGKRSGPWVYNKPDGTRNEAWSGTYEADVRVGD